MSTSGLLLRDSARTHAVRAAAPSASRPSVSDAGPVPAGRLAHRDQHRRQADRHQQAGAPRDLRPGLGPAVGRDVAGGQPEGDGDDDQRQPEQPLVGQPGHDRPWQHQAEAAADAEQRRHQADAPGDALARQPLPDDRERERVDAARRALDHPPGHEDGQVAGHRADQGAGRERGQAGQHHPLLARHLAQPADDGGEDARAEQVRGRDPGGVGGVDAEADLDPRQGRDDQRLHHRENGSGQRQHRQQRGGADRRRAGRGALGRGPVGRTAGRWAGQDGCRSVHERPPRL